MNNNDNIFLNKEDNLNNNVNSTQSITNNTTNSIRRQINNDIITTEQSINKQSNTQNNKSVFSALNNSETDMLTQQQVNTNSINNNLNIESTDTSVTSNITLQNNNVNTIPYKNIEHTAQVSTPPTLTNEDELLKSFIGKNYEKITTKKFNFAGFFLTTFYMFYRKMFLYAILLFLLNLIILFIINKFVVTLLINIAVGFLVNKIYLYYAKKKIAKIELQNPQKNINELKELCSAKGGTSISKIFLGCLAELGITFIVLIITVIAGIGSIMVNFLNPSNWNTALNKNEINTNDTNNDTNNSVSTKDSILMENVIVSGYSCIDSNCNISIRESNNYVNYVFNADNIDLFKVLDDYTDHVKIDIYYIIKNNEKTIINYKVFLKSNNEEISNIKTEDELRTKIGLYTLGTHTASLTLSKIGMTGAGFNDDTMYSYTDYTFIDNKKNEYEMKHIHSNGKLNLIKGNKYDITFEVVKGTFGYEFYIKNIN